MTFRKSLLHFFVLSFALFFWKTEIFLVTCFIGSHRSQSQHIVAQASQKFNMCNIVASTQPLLRWLGLLVSIGVHTLSAVVSPVNTCIETSHYILLPLYILISNYTKSNFLHWIAPNINFVAVKFSIGSQAKNDRFYIYLNTCLPWHIAVIMINS